MDECKINTVTIPVDRYDELKECEVAYENLTLAFAILLDKAELGWDEKSLRFDNNDNINDLLKVYDLDKYSRTISILKKKKEKGEKTDE